MSDSPSPSHVVVASRRHVALLVLAVGLASLGCSSMPNWTKQFPKSAAALGRENKTIEQRLAMARLFEKSSPQDAQTMYRKIVAEKPNERTAHHRLAVMAAGDGKFEDAERGFQTALSLAPPDGPVLADYGYALYLQHRLPEAEKVLRDAMVFDTRNAAVVNNLATVIGQQGRYDEALTFFRQVNSDAEAHANLGYLMSQRGDLDQAKFCYSHALSLDQELKSAAVALVQLAERDYAMAGHPLPPMPKRSFAQPNGEPQVASQPGANDDRTQVTRLAMTHSHDPINVAAPSIGQMPPGAITQPGNASGLASMAPYATNSQMQGAPGPESQTVLASATAPMNGAPQQSAAPAYYAAPVETPQPTAGRITGLTPTQR